METLSKTSCTLFEGCPFFSMGNCHPGHVCFQVAHGCAGLCCFCGRYGAGVTGSFSRLEAPTSATSSHTIPWELESLPLFFIIPQWVGGHASASDFTRRAKDMQNCQLIGKSSMWNTLTTASIKSGGSAQAVRDIN